MMNSKVGLSIIELLIVLAIIAGLLAVLLPSVQAARERAREAVCKNNLHQLNVAVAHYAEAHKRLPPPSEADKVGGWMVECLPFIEQQNLRNNLAIGSSIENVDASHYQPPPIFRCPRRSALEATSKDSVASGHYVLVPTSRRDSFLLFDAPVDVHIPWIAGPEMQYHAMSQATGPHAGGLFFTRGFQQGASLMLNGEVINDS